MEPLGICFARAGRYTFAGVSGGDSSYEGQDALRGCENPPPLAQPLEIPHRL